jgi:hypothetical protein
MATIKITNGFHGDVKDTVKNIILTGTLVSGKVKEGDVLVIDNQMKAKIIKVEFDSDIQPGIVHIRIFVPEEDKIVWHKLYGNLYETKEAS